MPHPVSNRALLLLTPHAVAPRVPRAGVSMDDMIFIATKLARQMDAQGTDTMFDAARQATVLMEEMRPLLDNVRPVLMRFGLHMSHLVLHHRPHYVCPVRLTGDYLVLLHLRLSSSPRRCSRSFRRCGGGTWSGTWRC